MELFTFSPLFIGEGSSTLAAAWSARTASRTFSPLFIGEGSSTLAPWLRYWLQAGIFQSPLHRGRVFNCLEDFKAISIIQSFSPLFIGEGSSTRGLQPRGTARAFLSVPSSSGKGLQQRGHGISPRRQLYFQSPLHRGRVFNGCQSARRSTSPAPFSPLFIGEGSSTNELVRLLAGNTSLSVPSSSGKGLQLERMEMHQRPPRPSFSPLFIGEGSSTLISPLTARPIASPFSPLFIGEGSSTFCSERRRSQVRLLSVPSSSGKGLQRGKNDAHRGRCDLSVPSSSGKGLQQLIERRRIFAWTPFSPLFIGEGSSTAAAGGAAGGQARLSVPSSSGKGLQLDRQGANVATVQQLSVPSSSGKGLQQ